jgi:tetratricopeptide (TPR) repeat protein
MVPALALVVALATSAAPLARSQSGHELFLARHYADARNALAAELRANPNDWRALLDLGRIAYLAHDPEQAQRLLERAATLAPDEAAVQHELGRAYAAQVKGAGRFRQLSLAGKIRDRFARAVALDPSNGEFRFDWIRYLLNAPGVAGGDKSRAHREADSLAARDAYWGHVTLGFVADKDGDLARSERELAQAIAIAPDSALPYYQLAYRQERERRWQDATQTMMTLLARRPDELGADFEIGRCAAESADDLADGRAHLEHFLARADGIGEPPVWEAHYWLGIIRERQNDVPGARAELQRALELKSDYREARDKLAALARDHPESVAQVGRATPDRFGAS